MRISPKWLFSLFPALLFGTASDRADPQASQIAGIKMTVRHEFAGMPGQQTIYIAADRRRTDYRNATGGAKGADGSMDARYGPHIASITRCDLGQMLELNLDAREYHAAPYPPKPLTKEQLEARGITPQATPPSEPTLLIEVTTVDTGERKEMFRHAARHVITTHKETPLAGSQAQAQESVTDGWYIDLNDRISCDLKSPKSGHAYVSLRLSTDGSAPDRPKFVDKGAPETGFAVERKITSRSTSMLPDGTKKENTSTNETIVTQLQEGPLDADVFEVPAGFREVAHIETNPAEDWQTAWTNAWERFKARVERPFD
jgi:hypothetical protein